MRLYDLESDLYTQMAERRVCIRPNSMIIRPNDIGTESASNKEVAIYENAWNVAVAARRMSMMEAKPEYDYLDYVGAKFRRRHRDVPNGAIEDVLDVEERRWKSYTGSHERAFKIGMFGDRIREPLGDDE